MKPALCIAVLSGLLLAASSVGAVSLSLGARGLSSGSDAVQALYGSNNSGEAVVITAVGREAPDGAAFTELGVPQMAPDGRVIFGAEETEMDGRHRWDIFVGDPNAPRARRVVPAMNLKSPKNLSGACTPRFRTDPYPVADADGDIAFVANNGGGRDALFLYGHGTLTCLAAVGDRTNEGHPISVLSYGTAQMGESGTVVFTGWLRHENDADNKNDRQALFVASPKTGVSELAVEGELGPNRTRYERPIGLPAVVAAPEGMLVAFTTKTPSGAALFLYRDGVMARVLPTGTPTALGPVTYLSPGRPGLASDGTLAVLAGCARLPAIFRLDRGRLNLRIRRGQLTPVGTELEALGDPVLTRSGAMFVGASDSEGREKLYVLDPDDALYEVGTTQLLYRIADQVGEENQHAIFTGTLTANQSGDFAYLGGR